MPHLSKRVMDPNVELQIEKALVFLIKNLQNEKDVNNFFNSIFSEIELKMIAKRIVAAFLIYSNVPPTVICELLKVTPETVNRLKMRIKLNRRSFDVVFSNLEKIKRKAEFYDTIEPILNFALKSAGGRIPFPKATGDLSAVKKSSIF